MILTFKANTIYKIYVFKIKTHKIKAKRSNFKKHIWVHNLGSKLFLSLKLELNLIEFAINIGS